MIYKKDPQAIAPYLKDASNYLEGRADKIIIPESVDELVNFLEVNDLPITISGAGTGMTASRIPESGSILSLEKFQELGDVENLEYNDNYFDVVTVGYGVRNFENLKKSLDEIYRVLKKNGTLVILETSVPKNKIIKLFYNFFTKFYVKLIGLLLSKNFEAYSYLQKSASNFPHGREFINILKNSKFTNISQDIKLFGASTIYVANK